MSTAKTKEPIEAEVTSIVSSHEAPESTATQMMRLENETIMSACTVRPRNLAKIRASLSDALDAFPELADECIYAKPVGKDESGKQKIARGLSVRAAELLAELYGYNRVRVEVTPIDDDSAKVEATFTDYQNGRIWQDSGVVSKWYKKRGGGLARHDDDRFYSLVCKAEGARRVREVILRSVNSALKAWLNAECEKRLTQLLTPEAVKKLIAEFGKLGVTDVQLEEFVGRKQEMGWTDEDRITLRGLYQAIRDGETTIELAFEQKRKAAPQSLDDVLPQEAKP